MLYEVITMQTQRLMQHGHQEAQRIAAVGAGDETALVFGRQGQHLQPALYHPAGIGPLGVRVEGRIVGIFLEALAQLVRQYLQLGPQLPDRPVG